MGERLHIDIAKGILKAFFEGDWIISDLNIGPCSIMIGGKIYNLFIAGQTENYKIESKRGHLYAPAKGFPRMREVKGKDIIFSYQFPEIKSINIALESAEKTYGTEEGRRIDCLYGELTKPLDITPIRLSKLANIPPFNVEGKLPQRGYIHHLDSRAARILLNEIKNAGSYIDL